VLVAAVLALVTLLASTAAAQEVPVEPSPTTTPKSPTGGILPEDPAAAPGGAAPAPPPAVAPQPGPSAPTTAAPDAPPGAPPAAPGPSVPSGTAIFGTIAGPDGPVAGARLAVTADGAPVGEATTGTDGSFRVPVPAAGRYQVHLDPASLPAGLQPADGRDTLDNVVVFAGRDKRVAFEVVAGSAPVAATGPTTLDRFAGLLVSGIRYGLVVALCAVGLTLIYGTTGLVNFAHGELVTFGALVAWFLSSSSLTWPLVLAAAVGFVVSAGFGVLHDVVLWQPLRRRRTGNIATIVISIGVALFLRNVYLVVFESNPRAFAQFATQEALTVGPVSVQPKELVSIAVCLVALAATSALLRWSRLGTAVRAVSDEPDLARASGIDVRGVFLTVWGLGAALAGLGGVLLALTQGVQWNMGLRVLLVVFAAVVVGGFGSPAGAMLGGLLIGVVSEVSTLWFSPDIKDVFSLGTLIVVLLIRPQGILGVRERVG
jgi:branched-chain amino acid transport system permease protein